MKEIALLITMWLLLQIGAASAMSIQPIVSNAPQSSAVPEAQILLSAFVTSDPITISMNSQFEDYATEGYGTAGDPYIIDGYSININGTGYGSCVQIMNTDAHFIIRDCEFIGKKYAAEYDPSIVVVEGILLRFQNVRNGLIENCTFKTFNTAVELMTCESLEMTSCTMTGVVIPSPDPYAYGAGFQVTELSNHCIIATNTIRDCSIGIGLTNNASDIVIEDNDIRQCGVSMDLNRWSLNNTIIGNDCSDSDRGILLTASNNTLIANNTCSSNRFLGISIDQESANNTLVFNTISNNGVGLTLTTAATTYISPDIGLGLYLAGVNNNVTMNDFIANGENCRNDGEGNIYDYNYWSDYAGSDSDGDGIGDTPYAISGDVLSADPHPRMARLSGTGAPLDVFIIIAFTAVALVVVAGALFLRRR